jgi:hypothetical protein
MPFARKFTGNHSVGTLSYNFNTGNHPLDNSVWTKSAYSRNGQQQTLSGSVTIPTIQLLGEHWRTNVQHTCIHWHCLNRMMVIADGSYAQMAVLLAVKMALQVEQSHSTPNPHSIVYGTGSCAAALEQN